MQNMFRTSVFNGDISEWDTSNVLDMIAMFIDSDFKDDISSWIINQNCSVNYMFTGCDIPDENKPKRLQILEHK